MSDKKEWREFWVKNNFEVDAWDRIFWRASDQSTHKDSDETHFIEHAAYEAEKQRADRLEKEKAEAIERSYELHKKDRAENQKLKEALEKITNAGCDHAYMIHLAEEALK